MSVKPLKRGYVERPTFFVILDDVLTPSGEVLPRSELPALFASQTEICRWVTRDSGHFASELDAIFHDTPRWNFTATDVPLRQGFDSKGRERIIYLSRAYRIGWRAGDKTNGDCAPSRYHEVIDINFLLSKHPLHEFTMDEVLERFHDVEDFCREHNLPIASSKGKLGRDLLRHPMFYQRERRKVPRATNDNLREYGLDGNYYALPDGVQLGITHSTVLQYDVTKAHPTVVADELVALPDSDSFYARGYFREAVTGGDFKPWLIPGTHKYERTTGSYFGAYAVCVELPEQGDGWGIGTNDDLAPAWIHHPRHTHRFMGNSDDAIVLLIHHNELYWLNRFNVTVRFICGAWLSPVQDKQLVKLSKWIIEQLDTASEIRKSWLKPALLAVFGGLATTPFRHSFSFANAKKGKPATVILNHRLPPIQGFRTQASKISEPGTNHVEQRALIESQTVNETLEAAILLRHTGFAPIHLYADSVYCLPPRNWNGVPPELPGWKVTIHTNFTSVHSHAVRSDQEVKLPGIAHRNRSMADSRAALRPRRSGFSRHKVRALC